MTPFRPRLNNYYAVEHQLAQHLLDRARARIARNAETRDRITTADEVRAWQGRTRRALLDAVGGLPEPGALNARVVGTIDGDAYAIEKVIYDAVPGFPVTANLYVPRAAAREARAPGILFLCGHSKEAKAAPAYQQVCALLARNGFVVLGVDPVGQGERIQSVDRETGEPSGVWGTREHSHYGLRFTLLGQNIARHFINDAVRGLDYLLSRPEVDPDRVGVTGNSGGGTQSCYLMAVDDRVHAAAPGCYVSSRARYMPAGQAHDAEQNLFGAIPSGLDHEDFLVAFAPRPVMVLSAAYDFFPIEGAEETVARVRRAYEVLGKPGGCRHTIGQHTHGYADPLKLAALRFFVEQFQPDRLPEVDERIPPALPPDALNCTRSGYVLVDDKSARTLGALVAQDAADRPVSDPARVATRVREIVARDRTPVPLRPRIIETGGGGGGGGEAGAGDQGEAAGYRWERLFFFTEPGIAVSGIFLKPATVAAAGGRLPVTVALLPDGTAEFADAELTARLSPHVGADRAVLVFDPRGTGAVRPDPQLGDELRRVYGTLFKLACDGWMLGDDLAAMRAYDVTRAFEYLRTRDDVAPDDIAVHAPGECGLVGLLAAVADGRVGRVAAPDVPASYAAAMREPDYDRRVVNEWSTLHGQLREFDTADLFHAVGSVGR